MPTEWSSGLPRSRWAKGPFPVKPGIRGAPAQAVLALDVGGGEAAHAGERVVHATPALAGRETGRLADFAAAFDAARAEGDLEPV
jgi:hypothetical protein